MFDSVDNNPIIGLKGQNLHLIHINFDRWDVSTGESNPSGEASKCENIAESKNNSKKILKPNKKKCIKIPKNDTILNKKTKRGKNQKMNLNLVLHYIKNFHNLMLLKKMSKMNCILHPMN